MFFASFDAEAVSSAEQKKEWNPTKNQILLKKETPLESKETAFGNDPKSKFDIQCILYFAKNSASFCARHLK